MAEPSTTSGLRTIGLVCIPSGDQDRLLSFYVETLGFEKRTDTPFGDGARWIEVYPPEGSTGIALAPPPAGTEVGGMSTGITLHTDDVDASHAALRDAGADVDPEVARWGDPVPPMFFLRDPEGNSLIVVEVADSE